jgi:alkanesulfonate monooxygenase SsuD/methylene tetrahydromethanopterin reductase-like flavin-dependent oxidoreductase (luciferase family)
MPENALQFGLLLHTAHMTGDGVERPSLDDLWEQTVMVEDLGYDSAWVGDSSRVETAWPRADCISIMAAMAMKTTTLRIGCVPLSVPLRNPILLGHALATVDVISNGRLIIGVSIGKAGPLGTQEFAACGVPANEKGARLTESLDLMRRLWTSEFVSFHGRFYELDGETGIRPRPIQQPIPTYVAAGASEAALKRAGRFGDGWFTTVMDPETFAVHRHKVDAYARDAGRESQVAPSALYATFHVDRDGEKAREDAKHHLTEYFGSHHRSGAAAGFFGSPDEVAANLQALVDRGLTMVVARIVSPDVVGQSKMLLEEVQARLTARPLGIR